jgi:hypothetical protein
MTKDTSKPRPSVPGTFDYGANPESYDAVTGKCWFCRVGGHSYRNCTTPEAVAYRATKEYYDAGGSKSPEKLCSRCGQVHGDYAGGC